MAAPMTANLSLVHRRRLSALWLSGLTAGSLRFVTKIGVCAAALLLLGARVEAQTATQTVTFSVIRPPRTAMMAPATTFYAPSLGTGGKATRASVAGSSYAISTNESNQKIALSLAAPMARGASLAVSLTPPAGAWSTGATLLGSTARDVVGGVSRASADALALEYTLTGRADMSRATLKTLVTFTITAGV